MLIDTIQNIERYRGYPEIYRALEYLATIREDNFPAEKVFLDADRLFFIPIRYQTKPESDAPIEAHELRADIHYILSGKEGVQIAAREHLEPVGVFGAEEADYGEFTGETEVSAWLTQGYFAVIFPGEAHRVSIADGNPAPVTKVLAKVTIH